MRLIDADALMETIRAHEYPLRAHFNSTDNGMFTIGIQQAVDEQPTIEIVRCKECKHGRLFDTNCVDCEYRELATDADWYCADGERRSDI